MNCLCFSPIGCHFSLLYVLYKYIYSAGHNGEKNQSVHPALLLPHWLFCATSFLTVSLLFTYTIFEWFQYKEGEGLVVSRRQTSFLPAVEDDDIKCSRLFAATKIMLFFFLMEGGLTIVQCSLILLHFLKSSPYLLRKPSISVSLLFLFIDLSSYYFFLSLYK